MSFVQLALLDTRRKSWIPGALQFADYADLLDRQSDVRQRCSRHAERFYYDGIEAMDLDSYSFSFSPSVDAIMEFKVQSSTYSADIGGAPGGQVNLTTKSGTNTFHGGLWWFNRNDAFTALNAFQPHVPGAKPPSSIATNTAQISVVLYGRIRPSSSSTGNRDARLRAPLEARR